MVSHFKRYRLFYASAIVALPCMYGGHKLRRYFENSDQSPTNSSTAIAGTTETSSSFTRNTAQNLKRHIQDAPPKQLIDPIDNMPIEQARELLQTTTYKHSSLLREREVVENKIRRVEERMKS